MNERMTLAILVVLIVGSMAEPTLAKYGGGSGEPNDPYQIWDANHMQAIGADANDWDKHFVLMADIDLGQFDGKDGREKFNVIGNEDNPFLGLFDGNNHTISNFTYIVMKCFTLLPKKLFRCLPKMDYLYSGIFSLCKSRRCASPIMLKMAFVTIVRTGFGLTLRLASGWNCG